MAVDFKYIGQLSGATTGAVEITLTGTVEIGDLLASSRAKAAVTDVTLAWLAVEAGDDGDDIQAIPILPGTILEGNADADIAEKGTLVGMAVPGAQTVDAAGATYTYFYNLDVVDISEDARCRVVYDPTYVNGALALAGA